MPTRWRVSATGQDRRWPASSGLGDDARVGVNFDTQCAHRRSPRANTRGAALLTTMTYGF